MTLTKNNLNSILINISNELNKYKAVDHETLFETAVEEKLQQTVLQYNTDINFTSDYILNKSSEKVLKTITKMRKDRDREILKQERKNKNND